MNQIEVFKFNSIYDEPKFETVRGKQWVTFGADNLAFDYIDSLLEMSADHSAIVNGLTQFTIGQGLVKPTDPKALAFYTNGEVNTASPNNVGEISKKIARDLAVYGGALINVRWRKDRLGISDVNYVDVRQMRPDVESGYWLSPDWKNFRKEANVPVHWPAFDASEEGKGGSQLLYLRIPNARKTPMALPHYWSVREYIEADQELITFHLNRVRNGFFPSTIIQLNDPSITPEEQDKNYKNLKDFFGGTMNAGKAAMLYGDNVKFEKFESSDVPQDFELLQATIDRKIRSGHRVAGRGDLFGLNTGEGTTFSSNDDLLNEFEVYSRTVVDAYQMVITDALQMLSSCNGISHTWEIEPFKLFEDATTTATPGTDEAPAPAETVADQAMNGAQVSSLIEIITSVGAGTISRETAKPLIQAAFPALSPLSIDAMLAGVKSATSPIPNPNPILQ